MEYWDIYDSSKQVTGRKMVRNDWHMKPGDYHLTVLALIRDAAGRILITQRKGDKEWAPLKWEIPGGGVRAGETSQEAVLRGSGGRNRAPFHPGTGPLHPYLPERQPGRTEQLLCGYL